MENIFKHYLNKDVRAYELDQIRRNFYKMVNDYFRPQTCDFESINSICLEMQRRLLLRKFEPHFRLIQGSDHLKMFLFDRNLKNSSPCPNFTTKILIHR